MCPTQTLPARNEGSPAQNRSARILVVDDELYIRDVISRWLTARGYECHTASNADEAWDMIESTPFSLVVTDIMMPGKSGIELLSSLRKQYRDIAVIMVTALDDQKTAVRALELGAYGYVIKPFDQNEVLIGVANALERRRLTLASEAYERDLEQTVLDRTAQIRQREEEIIVRLVSASEYRDEETGAHIRRIGLHAAAVARGAGWDAQRVADIRLSAPMHDIGKIGVPDDILLKPGKLTEGEFEIMKRHAEIGAEILANTRVPLLQVAMDVAHWHHENWDGSGYPQGLSGEHIPPYARIVAIVDTYDALVTRRVYRPALSEEEALSIMEKESAARFAPDCYRAFLQVLPELHEITASVKDMGL